LLHGEQISKKYLKYDTHEKENKLEMFCSFLHPNPLFYGVNRLFKVLLSFLVRKNIKIKQNFVVDFKASKIQKTFKT